jgi:hypothetical protein
MRNFSPILYFSTCIVVLSSQSIVLGQKRLPRFEDYPSHKVFKGQPAVPRLNFPKAREYKTMLRQYGKGPPDFAGHFRIVDIGCGTDCNFIFVVDVITGQVYYPDIYLNAGSGFLLDKEEGRALEQYGRQFRVDSRLLLSIRQSSRIGRGLFFYEWTGSRLRLVHKLVGRD